MEPRVDNIATLPTPTTTSELPLEPGHWALDEAHAGADFAVRHLGVSKVRGLFAGVDADLIVGSSLQDTAVNASIELASIDTRPAPRGPADRPPVGVAGVDGLALAGDWIGPTGTLADASIISGQAAAWALMAGRVPVPTRARLLTARPCSKPIGPS
jgi:hypothetical protein